VVNSTSVSRITAFMITYDFLIYNHFLNNFKVKQNLQLSAVVFYTIILIDDAESLLL
jgi:hypothetical protein